MAQSVPDPINSETSSTSNDPKAIVTRKIPLGKSTLYETDTITDSAACKTFVMEPIIPRMANFYNGCYFESGEAIKREVLKKIQQMKSTEKDDNKFNVHITEWRPADYALLKDPTVGPPLPASASAHFGKYIPVLITKPDAPWDFYVMNKDSLGPLEKLMNDMEVWYESNVPQDFMKFEDIQIWGYYAAKVVNLENIQNKWVRVLVTKEPKVPPSSLMQGIEEPNDPTGSLTNEVNCAIIDYGGYQSIECSKLRPLRQKFSKLPWGAYRGCIKTINNRDFQKTARKAKAERGFQDLISERNGELLGMVINEIEPDRLNNQPFITWEMFIRID